MRGRGTEYGDDGLVGEDGTVMSPTECAIPPAAGQPPTTAAPDDAVLAIDLGLRCGLAWYTFTPTTGTRLVRHRCTEFHSRARLKAAVASILAEFPGLVLIVGEGDRDLWAIWTKAAAARRIAIRWVSPETWRMGIWGTAIAHDARGKDAKAKARQLAEGTGEKPKGHSPLATLEAEGLIHHFGNRSSTTRIRTDAAEAVCLGFWAVREKGWT